MKAVLKWIVGLTLFLFALVAFFTPSYIGFSLFLISAIICLPPTLNWIENKLLKIKLNRAFKYIAVLALPIFGISFTGSQVGNRATSQSNIFTKNDSVTDSILQVRKAQRTKLMLSFDSLAKANSLRIEKDEFKPDVAFYKPKDAPNSSLMNWMYPYLAKSSNYVSLRYKIQYESDDWLFIENVKVKVTYENGNEKIVDLYSGRFDRDNGSGKIWEWNDTKVDDAMYLDLLTISKAKTAKIRFNGSKYYKERIMTKRELKALNDVINVYKQIRE